MRTAGYQSHAFFSIASSTTEPDCFSVLQGQQPFRDTDPPGNEEMTYYLVGADTVRLKVRQCEAVYDHYCEEATFWFQKTQAVDRGEESDHFLL